MFPNLIGDRIGTGFLFLCMKTDSSCAIPAFAGNSYFLIYSILYVTLIKSTVMV